MNKRIITIIIALAAVCGGAKAQQKQGKAFRPRFKQSSSMLSKHRT